MRWGRIAYLEGTGQYATDWKVLDALELGVPQNRHRLFVLKRTSNPERLPNGDEFFNADSAKFKERAEDDVAHKSFKRLHRYRYSPPSGMETMEVHLHPWKPRRLSAREDNAPQPMYVVSGTVDAFSTR